MFNGIIFNQGRIVKISKTVNGINLFLKSKIKLSKKNLGVSVSCDGVCLTLISVKKDIIEHLWKVIISDNSVDQYESNLMRRICGLIYFSDKESGEIKMRLLKSK